MKRQIFVNLPVNDLNRSMEFFKQLGFGFNAQFTDETAACMVVSDDIFVMLLTHPKFREFAPHPVCDAKQETEVLMSLNVESRQQVDEVVNKALDAGGTTFGGPIDMDFMYGQSFQDLDGHVWEVFYMEPAKVA